MFARRVSMHLKPNSVRNSPRDSNSKFSLASKTERVQGRNHVYRPGRNESVRNQFVGNKENAEAYNRGTYAEVKKFLAGVIEGTPQVETYEVSNSTFHKIAAAVAV